MKPFYIFLSLVGIFFLSNNTAFAQTKESNEKVVHKAIDKMNYEFARAVLDGIKRGDKELVIKEETNIKDTTFAKVVNLKPSITANSVKRIFSKEKLSDGVTGYIYEIEYIRISSTNFTSNTKLLDKIALKIISRTKDFGNEQKDYALNKQEIVKLEQRLNKIKNSAISQLKSDTKTDVKVESNTTKQDSTTKKDTEVKTEEIQTASSEVIYYRINQEEKRELIGSLGDMMKGEKPTYQFGLDVKSTDSVKFFSNENPKLDTSFLASNFPLPIILENKNSRYIIDLNIATTQEDGYMMWIIFGVIAVSVIAFVMYKQSQKETKKDIVKKDPLSRYDGTTKVASTTNQDTDNKERQTILIQNQIQEEKNRLTAILINDNLSNEEKIKQVKNEKLSKEVASDVEVIALVTKIEQLLTNHKIENETKETLKENQIQDGEDNTQTQKVVTPPKNIKNYHESLYVSLSDIGENGIKSERKKGMSNTIFVIRPYSEGENEAKKADFTLHSEIKDMAFESIFRSIEKLDHLMEHSTFTDTARKITQEEKGELIKEDNVWKVKKRLKVKFI